jgi:membrane-associated phospholipid phosphatase
MQQLLGLLLGLLLVTLGPAARAEDSEPLHPATGLGRNLARSFTGPALFLHWAAVASTYALIETDTDYHAQRYFASQRASLDPHTVPAVWLGYFFPVVLGGGLLAHGYASKNRDTIAAGSAVLQATAITVAYTSVLKATTGRPNPNPEERPDVRSASREFPVGFMRGGIHYGWPSGHLAVSTAAVVGLATTCPDRPELALGGVAYLGYLAFGVAAHEGATMHWLSDVVAGTLIGVAVGHSVGGGFHRSRIKPAPAPSVAVMPAVAPDGVGIGMSGTF